MTSTGEPGRIPRHSFQLRPARWRQKHTLGVVERAAFQCGARVLRLDFAAQMRMARNCRGRCLRNTILDICLSALRIVSDLAAHLMAGRSGEPQSYFRMG